MTEDPFDHVQRVSLLPPRCHLPPGGALAGMPGVEVVLFGVLPPSHTLEERRRCDDRQLRQQKGRMMIRFLQVSRFLMCAAWLNRGPHLSV